MRVHAKIRQADKGPRQIFTVSSGFHNEVFIRAEPSTMRQALPSRICDSVTQCVCVAQRVNQQTYI